MTASPTMAPSGWGLTATLCIHAWRNGTIDVVCRWIQRGNGWVPAVLQLGRALLGRRQHGWQGISLLLVITRAVRAVARASSLCGWYGVESTQRGDHVIICCGAVNAPCRHERMLAYALDVFATSHERVYAPRDCILAGTRQGAAPGALLMLHNGISCVMLWL
eukprot:m.672156 g.672156  ORF g.672156 m.672156 type:complete len:163 (+) comp22776_c1_seq29:2382-2870(+)